MKTINFGYFSNEVIAKLVACCLNEDPRIACAVFPVAGTNHRITKVTSVKALDEESEVVKRAVKWASHFADESYTKG